MRAGILISALVLSLASLIAVHQDVFWRWDQLVYDTFLSALSRPAPDDVLIIAVDEVSLEALGQWPWPRRYHAELLGHLDEAEVVIFDVLFAEPDRDDPENDALLARAVAASGKVVMPMANSERQNGGVLMEVLPLPALTAAARALGHTDIPLDRDGMARHLFLHGGLGGARWPHMALAAADVLGLDVMERVRTLKRQDDGPDSPLIWVRDDWVLIPFIGPPGHFRHIPYADVLSGRYPPGAFAGKVVLIGATASGLSDFLPTPVSGGTHPMAGVEIVANVFVGLRDGTLITELNPVWRSLLTLALVLLPFVLIMRVRTQWALGIVLVFTVMPTVLSFSLLSAFQLWAPPVTSSFLVVASYILWSTARLLELLRVLDSEIDRLGREPVLQPRELHLSVSSAASFLSRFLPLRGVMVTDSAGAVLECWGETPDRHIKAPLKGQWTRIGSHYWTSTGAGRQARYVGILWGGDEAPTHNELLRLSDIAQHSYGAKRRPGPRTPVAFLQDRISQLQSATAQLRAASRFIGETVAQSSSGMLVVDNFGIVRLSNAEADRMMTAHDEEALSLVDQPVEFVISRLHFRSTDEAEAAMKALYRHNEPVSLEAEGPGGRQLLVNLGSFTDDSSFNLNGIIIQLVDVTRLKAAEQRNRDMLGFISHDFRAPLVSIIAIMDTYRMIPETFDTARADRIDRMARNALEMADNLLHLMRGQELMTANFQAVNLTEVADSALMEVAPQAAAKGIELLLEPAEAECRLLGDEHLLIRLYTNLLTNAIKYSPEATRVRIAVWRDGDRVCTAVADQGDGISAEELPTLFDRYKAFRREGRVRGTGLGLAMVRSVTTQHQGDIHVASEPGQGTTFRLCFPAAPADAAGAGHSA